LDRQGTFCKVAEGQLKEGCQLQIRLARLRAMELKDWPLGCPPSSAATFGLLFSLG